MANTTSNKEVTRYRSERYIEPIAAAAPKIWLGAMVIQEKGYMKAVSGVAQGHLRVAGVSRGGVYAGQNFVVYDDADNSAGAAGALWLEYETGVFLFKNDTGKPLVIGDGGKVCYAVDDEMVSLNSNYGNYPIAGIFLGIEPKTSRAIVAVGMVDGQMPKILSVLANADLSAAAKLYVPIKLVASGGKSKADVCSATTDLVTGLLLNNPAAGDYAYVCYSGICPGRGDGAAGFTAAAQLMSAAAGDGSINATTGKPSYGQALETAAVNVSGMVLVTGPGGYKI